MHVIHKSDRLEETIVNNLLTKLMVDREGKMKTNPARQEGFTILRTSLSRLNLPLDLVGELIERHIPVSYEKGALAFCEGNTDGMIACILSGYVKVYCPVADGNRTLVRLAGPGEIIGYSDYIDEKGRSARLFEVQAASKCMLALFSRDHVARLLADLPQGNLISILAALNTFWSENLRFFTTLLNLPFWDRLTVVLTDLAKRAGVRDSEGIILIPEVFHEDLAEMIGCSRPMVSRLMAQMIESGLIGRRGKQYVLLKKWNFADDIRNPQKAVARRGEVYSGASPTLAVANGSASGSAGRGVTAYAARGPG
jgi:CRP/FNR family cyclic AMP-dependent transcriptional regulator